jgi:hypothetical protein
MTYRWVFICATASESAKRCKLRSRVASPPYMHFPGFEWLLVPLASRRVTHRLTASLDWD